MPDTDIERTIFKLELDGSAYVQGVDSVTNATKKFSNEQEKSNAIINKLKEANIQLAEETKSLSATYNKNAKELRELLFLQQQSSAVIAKQMEPNIRKYEDAQKKLSAAIVDNKNVLKQSNAAIKDHEKSLISAEKASGGFVGGLQKTYAGLGRIANIIPGLGIAGLVAMIAGPLVEGIQKWISGLGGVNKALEATKINQQNVNDVMASANKEAGKQITDLKILYQVATDVNIPMKERLEAVNSLQKEFPLYFKNIKDETILNGDAKKSYDELTLSIQSRARATAAKTKLDEIEAKKLDVEFQNEKIINATRNEINKERARLAKQIDFIENNERSKRQGFRKDRIESAKELSKIEEDRILERRINALRETGQNTASLNAQSKFLIDFAGLGNIADSIEEKNEKKFKEKAVRKKREIDNVFQQEFDALDLKLKEATRKEAEDESKIKDVFAARLEKEKGRIQKLLDDKKLKPGSIDDPKSEAGQLFVLATKENDLLLKKALEDRRKRAVDARQKLNDELKALQDKNMQDNLNLIQEEFDRRSKLIDFNEKKELENSQAATKKRLDALELEKLLIEEKAYQDAKAVLIESGEQAALNIIQRFANQRKDLAADIFQSLLSEYDNAIRGADLIRDEQTAKDVKALADKLLSGKITYENFQKEIKKIQKQADRDSKEGTLAVDRDKLQALDNELKKIEDKNSAHYKRLKKQRDEQKSKVDKEQIALDKDQDAPEVDPRFARVQKYAEAIGSLTASIIAFWQKANEAESKALDRSISLQEKRVEAAQRIAARGNAQYLKAEEDRLKELTIKRENAARRELGINAALQSSQLLVGITGAIAKIATPGIGIAETIGAIAVIFGALATGYGLVKSLQGNQPKLAGGSKYVRRDGHPAGTDTIPALINEGEAVIPTDTNKAYHPTVAAIYDKTIPPEHLNNFVQNYHRIKPVPQPNYDRIRETAELHITENGRMAYLLTENNRKLDEQNDLQRQTLRTLNKLGVNVTLDKNGFAVTQMEVIEQIQKDKRI